MYTLSNLITLYNNAKKTGSISEKNKYYNLLYSAKNNNTNTTK
jgi:hypothetical protein